MKFKIKTDIQYQVFDKAIKATITVLDVPERVKQMSACYYNLNDNHMPKTPLQMSYSGVAVLKEGDNSDIELAKTIARKKAQRALYRNYEVYMREILARIAAIYRNWTDYSLDVVDKAIKTDTALKEM